MKAGCKIRLDLLGFHDSVFHCAQQLKCCFSSAAAETEAALVAEDSGALSFSAETKTHQVSSSIGLF